MHYQPLSWRHSPTKLNCASAFKRRPAISSNSISITSGESDAAPLVSIIIATYNAEAHIRIAVESALAQSLRNIEVLVVDDCSSDRTREVLATLAAKDKRVITVGVDRNVGPAAARNRAIELARGQWIAILDSDDLLRRERIERLVERAENLGADIISDNLIVFEDCDLDLAENYIEDKYFDQWIDTYKYLELAFSRVHKVDLGYLKPLIRLDRLRENAILYDETLRIAEDDDLILRMLAAGMRYWLHRDAGYLYRRHKQSTSFRLSSAHASAISAAARKLRHKLSRDDDRIAKLMNKRCAQFEKALIFSRFVDELKASRLLSALILATKKPVILIELHKPAMALLRRFMGLPPTTMVKSRNTQSSELVRGTLALLGEAK